MLEFQSGIFLRMDPIVHFVPHTELLLQSMHSIVLQFVESSDATATLFKAYLNDDIRYSISHVRSGSWISLPHAHRELNVCLLGGVPFTVGALGQSFRDN